MALPEPDDDALGAGGLVRVDRRGTVLLRVHVQPGARRVGIDGYHDGALRVRVREVPERGRANEAVCAAVAEALHLRPSEVRVVAGGSARRKTLGLSGVPVDEVVRRLGALLAPDVQD